MRVRFTSKSMVEKYESKKRLLHFVHSIRHNRYLFLSVLLMILIFLLSSQNASESSKLSTTLADFIGLNTIKFINIRKLAHFTLFGLLGGCVFTHIRFMRHFKNKLSYYGLAFIVTMLYAISDEIHQLFVSGRGSSIIDVGIDSLGCIVVLMINFIIISLLERRDERKEIN